MKKTLAIFMALAISFTGLEVSNSAESDNIQIIPIICSTEYSAQMFQVLQDNDTYYMAAEDIAKITRFEYKKNGDNHQYVLGKNAKYVVVNPNKNTITIMAKELPFKTYKKTSDGRMWLSLSELLPWLNVDCYIENNVLHIASDEVTFWEAVTEFFPEAMDKYYFDISEELGGTKGAASTIISMLVFDTILGLRLSRAIPVKNGSLHEYNVYMNSFREFATDDSTLSEETKKLAKSVGQLSNINNFLKDVSGLSSDQAYNNIDKALQDYKAVNDVVKIKELFGALSFVESSILANKDYYKSFQYIYGVPFTSTSKKRTTAEIAAETAYNTYKSNIGAITTSTFASKPVNA